MSTILIVDDEAPLLHAVMINLRARGFVVEGARTGRRAVEMCEDLEPDAVILDLGLPDVDGIDVLARIRSKSQVPVLVLSARSSSSEKVRALDAGADDYVSKPFDMRELVARVRATIRRASARSDTSRTAVVSNDAFEVDRGAATVTRDGQLVRLTPTEWHILDVLAAHTGKLVTQKQLLAEVWGTGYEQQAHYLRVYIAGLRRKLEPEPSAPRHIVTESGRGYRLI